MSEDRTSEEEKRKHDEKIEKYKQMFQKCARNVVADFNTGMNLESPLYSKYPKKIVKKMLENPYRNEQRIRGLNNYIYTTSTHYRRLLDYYSSILLYNYVVIPTNIDEDSDPAKVQKNYQRAIKLCNKYNFKQEAKKAVLMAIKDGIFCGLSYETANSFYIRPFDPNWTRVTSITDGCFVFSIDLAYFNNKPQLIEQNVYGNEINEAYRKYREDKSFRFFEPSNGICIKADITDEVHSFPLFLGLIQNVYDIEEYSVIEKTRAKNNIYKAIVMKMETDDEGTPKLDEDLTDYYYEQAVANVNENIGIIMSPFSVDSISFADTTTSDMTDLMDAQEEFWEGAGVSSLIFGSPKATSSSSLTLSVKPDEQITFDLLKQFERYFNMLFKKKNLDFKIRFLDQSIFNANEVANRYEKAATYGVGGAKLSYAAAIDLEPNDVIGMSFLEDKVLGLGDRMFTQPLISSNTQSSKDKDTDPDTGGRPSNESEGLPISDSEEKTIEQQ